MKLCECGCGQRVKLGKNFIHGHYAKLHPPYPKKILVQERIKCACGCGGSLEKYDKKNRTRKFINGHNLNLNPRPMQDPTIARRVAEKLKGRERSKEYCQNISKAKKGKELNLSDAQRQRKSENNLGFLNPSWRSGISREPYCFEFTNELKESIKERDGYICQSPSCDHKSRILIVHHINYVKKDCEPENLITLCNSCNSKANFNKDKWQKLFEEIIRTKEKAA